METSIETSKTFSNRTGQDTSPSAPLDADSVALRLRQRFYMSKLEELDRRLLRLSNPLPLDVLVPKALGRYPLLYKVLRKGLSKTGSMLMFWRSRFNRELLDGFRQLASLNTYFARELNSLLQQSSSRPSDAPPSATGAAGPHAPPSEALDKFYAAFEKRFRGDDMEVLLRLRKSYLPILEERGIVKLGKKALDIGCGRGEWLSVLRSVGIDAQGIDLNRTAVEQSRAKGLDTLHGDGLAYLATLPDSSLSLISAFHVIEHLPFETLFGFVAECRRVLCPGGVIIVETPNPQNVLVGSHTFYLDPTHERPLPSGLTSFLIEYHGFSDVYVVGGLQPYPEEMHLKGSELAERFNEYFYGAQDYGVVGTKA